MRKHTKIISILLALIIMLGVFGIIPFSVFAIEADKVATGDISTTNPNYEYTWLGPDKAAIARYIGTESAITIPSSLDGYSITEIGVHAFEDCKNLTRVTIPNGVKTIDNYAFNGCSSLTHISIPDSVTRIGGNTFEGCSSLTEITIPHNVTYIGEGAFMNSGLTNVIIPEGVTSIRNDTFYKCNDLINVTIPNGVTSIGGGAFFDCVSLLSIHIPSSVSRIYSRTFSGCSSLKEITVSENNSTFESPNNCNAIIRKEDNSLIQGCKNTIIPDGVKKIGDSAFYRCTTLTNINISDSVTQISNSAFADCTSLTSVSLGNGITEINNQAFFNCSVLKSITIPPSIKEIGYHALGYNFGGLADVKTEIFTICGFKGTVAETYANNHRFTFIALDEYPEPKAGDADGDGEISSLDVTYIQRYLVNIDAGIDEETLMNADVDKNGLLEIVDATFIQRHLANIAIPYEIG